MSKEVLLKLLYNCRPPSRLKIAHREMAAELREHFAVGSVAAVHESLLKALESGWFSDISWNVD